MDHRVYLYLMDPGGNYVRAFDSGTSGDRIADALRVSWRRYLTTERQDEMQSPRCTRAGSQQITG